MTKKLDWVSVWVQVEHASERKSRVLCDTWHGKKVFLLGFVTGNTWMVSTSKNLRPVMCKCLHTWINVIVHKTCFQFFCQFSQCILQTLWVLQAQSLHSVSTGVNETKVPSSLLQLFLLNQGLAKQWSGDPNWGRMRFTFQFGKWDGSYPTALLVTNSPTCKEVCASLNQSFFGSDTYKPA
jgi:hypothetical protein